MRARTFYSVYEFRSDTIRIDVTPRVVTIVAALIQS